MIWKLSSFWHRLQSKSSWILLSHQRWTPQATPPRKVSFQLFLDIMFTTNSLRFISLLTVENDKYLKNNLPHIHAMSTRYLSSRSCYGSCRKDTRWPVNWRMLAVFKCFTDFHPSISKQRSVPFCRTQRSTVFVSIHLNPQTTDVLTQTTSM